MRTAAYIERTPTGHAHYPISLSDLAQALDHSDEGFALTDPEGNYVYINDAHLRIYGYEKPQDLLGRSWRTLYTPEWVRYFEEAVLPKMPRDLVWRGQVIGKRKNGTSFLAGVTLTLLPDGKITCNCRDESMRREAPGAPAAGDKQNGIDESETALRELGERLVSGLPAKLRRPLDLLTGYSSFFLAELQAGRDLPTAALLTGLNQINATARRLAEQMHGLELAAALAVREDFCGEANFRSGESGDWCDRLIEACRGKAILAGRSDDLHVELENAPLTMGYAELECVAIELLTNAFQSSRAGDAVRVSGRMFGQDYELCFCDEGVGIHEDRPGAGDRPFGQATPQGFGLALVRFLLRKNGGDIEADRTRTDLTCQKVTLPLRS